MTTKKVVIIDYKLGNLFSVQQACLNIGLDVKISSKKEDIISADALILPGVGAFADAMDNLTKSDLVSPIKDFIASGKPFMGICLGLQLLFSESEEFGASKGLGIIPGTVKKFKVLDGAERKIRVPHIGWNSLIKAEENTWSSSPLSGIRDGEYMYFVHSYFVSPESNDIVVSRTVYEGVDYCSSIQKKNIFAAQFHPEKSAFQGLKIYWNWANEFLD